MHLRLQAVSADQSGSVSVWFVPTGKLRFRFNAAPKGSGNKDNVVTLTALNFDSAKRRLLTGGSVWILTG